MTRAQLVKVEVEDSADQPIDWQSALDSDERLEWLMFVSAEHVVTLEAMLTRFYQFIGFKEIRYLVDRDVLQSFLEVDSSDSVDTFATDALFFASKQKYAIPAGAFLEFLSWFSQLHGSRDDIPTRVSDLTREQLAVQLAKTLRVAQDNENEVSNIDDIVERIGNTVEQRIIGLTRLLGILTDPRFVGVVADYDDADVATLEPIIQRMPRYRDNRPVTNLRERRNVDHSDAINLAIAIKAVRGASSKDTCVAYILVTKTRGLLNLVSTLQEDLRDSKAGRALGKLVGKPGPILQGLLPVLSPKQVRTAEKLDIFEHPEAAIGKTTALAEAVRTIKNHAERLLLVRRTAVKAYQRTLAPYLAQERALAAEAMQRLAEAEDFRALEEERATGAQVHGGYLEQGAPESEERAKLLGQSASLLDLIDQVAAALENIKGFEYQVGKEAATSETPFDRLTITQTPRPHVGALLTGETFYDSASRATHYALRWRNAGRFKNFFDGVKQLLSFGGTGTAAPRNISEVISLAGPASEYWHQGMLLYTSAGLYGLPLDVITNNYLSEEFSLRLVRRAIEKHRQQVVGDQDGFPQRATIQHVRVNCAWGSLAYDVAPAEGDSTGYITVVSIWNLAPHIALLYRKTRPESFVSAGKFAAVISSTLTQFPNPPEDPVIA